ncbi:MAG: hypothetical protein ABI175_07395, partial [Polyangiales bacterium]
MSAILFAAMSPALGCGDSTDVNPVTADTALFDSAGDRKESGIDAADGAPEVATDSPGSDTAEASVDAGTAADCLPTTGATGLDAFFTLNDASKCVVAQYTVEATFLSSLTWGRHRGPLGFDGSDVSAPKLVRYKLPATATGALVRETTAVTVTSIPAGVFFGSQALDLPFFGWTAISYSGSGAGFPGELLLIGDTTHAIDARYHVNGFFSESATAMATSGGRLLYSGLSVIGSAPSATSAGGLYAADSCGTAASSPRLLPSGDATCKDPIQVGTWESGSSGPVATDPNENVFAVLSSFGGNQELRGFERAAIARGAPATPGTKIFSTTGDTGELVADGKIVVWQPNESLSVAPYSKALDVQAIDYTVDAGAKTVTASGAARAFLTLKTEGTSVALLLDDAHRIWVGVTNP